MEVGAAHVRSKPVKSGKGFTDVVQWTLATAASNHLNVLRSFGHGTDTSFPLQEKPGLLSYGRANSLFVVEKLFCMRAGA